MTTSNRQACECQVRWLIRRDMPEVLAIEDQSFAHPWTEADFLSCLKERNCIGMVAEHGDKIVGYMVYELLKTQLHVLNFAVAIGYRRQGVGSRMVAKLVGKLAQQRRQVIRVEVRESNLYAQLFFKANGFVATDVLRGHYEDTAEDAYVMRYDIKEPPAAFNPFATKNRILDF